MTDNDKALVERLRELEVKATTGPWVEVGLANITTKRVVSPKGWVQDTRVYCLEDAILLVNARNALPTLLDRIEAQAAEIERLREECEAQYHRGYYDGRAALGEKE